MSGSEKPPAEDPIRGILLTLGATILFTVSDTLAKFLSTELPVVQISWIRYVIFVGFAAALSWRASSHDKTRMLAVKSRPLQIARGLCLVGSGLFFILGVRQMAIAEAIAISFIAPLLITVMSIPILGEIVGIRRWIAVASGMLGVLIVVRPGTAGFQPAALFGLASALCWSTGLVITRKIANTERASTTLLWSAGVGLLILTILLPFNYAWPTLPQFALTLTLGCCASGGQWMVVLAHRQAPASVLAPFTYIQLPWSVLAGYVVFSAMPDRWMLLGAVIIIASGLYTAHRERVQAAERRLSL